MMDSAANNDNVTEWDVRERSERGFMLLRDEYDRRVHAMERLLHIAFGSLPVVLGFIPVLGIWGPERLSVSALFIVAATMLLIWLFVMVVPVLLYGRRLVAFTTRLRKVLTHSLNGPTFNFDEFDFDEPFSKAKLELAFIVFGTLIGAGVIGCIGLVTLSPVEPEHEPIVVAEVSDVHVLLEEHVNVMASQHQELRIQLAEIRGIVNRPGSRSDSNDIWQGIFQGAGSLLVDFFGDTAGGIWDRIIGAFVEGSSSQSGKRLVDVIFDWIFGGDDAPGTIKHEIEITSISEDVLKILTTISQRQTDIDVGIDARSSWTFSPSLSIETVLPPDPVKPTPKPFAPGPTQRR